MISDTRGLLHHNGFDYAVLPRDTTDKVRAAADRIRTQLSKLVADLIQLGNELLKVKAVLGHGRFGKWLQAEFAWSERTAQRFISVAESFGPICDNLADLPLQACAMYLLAAPSVPDEARQTAVRRAGRGELITHALAKAIIAEVRGNQPPVSEDHRLARVGRLLERYKDRCSPDECADLARLLRGLLDMLEHAPQGEAAERPHAPEKLALADTH